MEKRFVFFLLMTFGILAAYTGAKMMFAPPEEVAEAPADGANDGEQPGADGTPGDQDAGTQDGATDQASGTDDTNASDGGSGTPKKPASSDPSTGEGDGEDVAAKPAEDVGDKAAGDKAAGDKAAAVELPEADANPRKRLTLGSMDPKRGFRALVTLNSVGAALERVELTSRQKNGRLRYRDLERRFGYLGNLALENVGNGEGARIQVVGSGTPAALAKLTDSGGASAGDGLQVGDVIREFNGVPIDYDRDLEDQLKLTSPGDEVELSVEREIDGEPAALGFQVSLSEPPLELIRPEEDRQEPNEAHPASLLLSIAGVGDRKWDRPEDEPKSLAALREASWEVVDASETSARFRLQLSEEQLAESGLEGDWEFIKQFRIQPVPESEWLTPDYPGYHVELDVEIRNLGDQPQEVSYLLSGPNGLPTEGWWYSTKIHGGSTANFFAGMFKGAGARDVIWRPLGYSKMLMFGCSQIHSQAIKYPDSPGKPLINPNNPSPLRTVGVDAQYFSAMILPSDVLAKGREAEPLMFRDADAVAIGDPSQKEKREIRTTNVSVSLVGALEEVSADKPLKKSFVVFAGPKRSELLNKYDLDGAIQYGWFGPVARPLSWVLHGFYQLVGNYGIAIIMLTVLVRGVMLPISRKAAKNAQKMQELAPELKKLADKYKDNMEKRQQAQKELFAKHNYNPAGGCLLMFLQLPVFIGLYRCLSVDIELRQAALIPGIDWCSNLAGPDMLWRWDAYLPDWIASETGWLGPYLNILPFVTISLFILQQKLFTPPPTDEQSRMQQQVMKFMMVFMGVLFFKVPAGLCLYFITSSLWGICERLLLPKPKAPGAADNSKAAAAAKSSPAKVSKSSKSNGNGSTKRGSARRKQRKR